MIDVKCVTFHTINTLKLLKMYFRPSQWASFIAANIISGLRTFLPGIKQWAWYIMRRSILLCTAKYAIDTFWLCFKKRKLGVSFIREISMQSWVSPNFHYSMDPQMRILIRKCGYHYNTAGIGVGKSVQPWFYGDIKDETKQILQRMEASATKRRELDRKAQAGEMQAVSRVLKNFKEFTTDEIMAFFKVSELMYMEKDQVIFDKDDKEEYFYGVVSGEIHLFGDGISPRGAELLKVADSNDCIVSLNAILRIIAFGMNKYEKLRLFAKCGKSGKYYRVPIMEIINYTQSDTKKMRDMLTSIIWRQHKFTIGINDLTGILPRLHTHEYLDPKYTEIKHEPGIITGDLAEEAFAEIEDIFPIKEDDRRLCWVGVLDSRSILLRRYKETSYAFFICKGLVECTISKLRRSYNAVQFYLTKGQIVGWREAVVGLEMSVQYQVADGARAMVIAIPGFLIRKYVHENPQLVAGLLRKLMERFSLLAFQIAYTLKFSERQANEALHQKTDHNMEKETHAYLCLSGRLRFIFDSDPSFGRANAQFGIIETGDWFGLVAMYTDSPEKRRTVICDRTSEYVAVPRYTMALITRTFRESAGYQCDYVARSIHRDHEHTFLDTDKMADTRFQVNSFGAHTWRTYRMICVYPAAPDIPAKLYCEELARHHTSSAAVVTHEDALVGMEIKEFTRDYAYALAKWLVLQEEKSTVLFLVATNPDTDHIWNETIAQLSDMIQVLVTYELHHKPDEDEQNILQMAKKARKELVFIHPVLKLTKPQIGPGKFPHLPKGSILWLRPRPWVQRHHHVRMLDSALRYAKFNEPEDLEKYYNDTKDPDKHSDFARIMRWISGESIGVVLGGGGAKGAAHLGALRYLTELNVPVDYIAGVSIGSFLGALYALYENINVVEVKARELWEALKNPARYARDLQFHPFSAIFRGHSFNWMINYFFDNIQIEDLFIPYFCVTSDLQDNCSRTHMSGELWFYVRASMTLTMVFPPQINQFDYHLLMDGGYSDLVPAMTMRRLGIKYLVAINIGDERLIGSFNIGYHVSGLKCLLQCLHPFAIDYIPNYFEFWDALLYCSARNFIQILKAMDEYCIYIRPNINAYTALDFQNFEEMMTLGYLSTKFKFGGLRLQNLPVHVIWYLLRFYTYPNIAMSQAQMLQGFTESDWEFAVNIISKTQMFQRARTTFLKMNLTPYLTDLMEAHAYLENILKRDEVKNINLQVSTLENFSRDDERLDLVHAIARVKEWSYMEDFESIIKEGSKAKRHKVDLKIRTKVHAAASQSNDLDTAKGKMRRATLFPTDEEDEEISWVSNEAGHSTKGALSIKDLYQADPTLFHAVASYRHLHHRKAVVKRTVTEEESEAGFNLPKSHSRRTNQAGKLEHTVSSIRSLVTGFVKTKQNHLGHTSDKGQRLDEFRKCLTTADRKRLAAKEAKMTHIVTLKELRKSFEEKEKEEENDIIL